MLKSLFHLVIFALLAAAALIGLFVAWWIAVFVLLCVSAYLLVRRFLGRPVTPAGVVVIEGEYQVERDGEGRPTRPRVIIDGSGKDSAA